LNRRNDHETSRLGSAGTALGEETRKLPRRGTAERNLAAYVHCFMKASRGIHMKRFLITLLAAILIGGVASAQSFPDIPANHWAADAVEQIADLGIVIGFPDGTFRGNEAFTRYQAALVVSRLLGVIESNMDQMAGQLRDEMMGELAGLRASMQGLAGDVASQGVRLSAVESAVAGLSDDVAANAARIAAVEAAMGDQAVLRDLQNQIASLRVGVDTAQAQAEAAAARADQAYDLALQATAQADQTASDLAALNRVVQLLSQRLDAMGVPAPAPMPDLTGLDRLEGDIANIREFVILLRRDQVALRDRVAALEASDAAQTARINALESDLGGRIAELERTALRVSGSIALTYNAIRFEGTAAGFDIDRAYGMGMTRNMGLSALSTGPTSALPAHRRAEFTATPGFDSVLTLNLSLGGFGAGALVLDAVQRTFNAGGPDGAETFLLLRVRSFQATVDDVGGAPLTFAFGQEVSSRFTTYVMDIRNTPGFRATIGAPDFLGFLNPTLTVVYYDPQGAPVGGVPNPLAGTTNITGIRGTMAPSFGDAIIASGGFSYGRYAEDTGALGTATDVRSVWGVDGQIGLLGLIALDFEYASATTGESVLFVRANVDGAGLPIINTLGANYRDIDAGWIVPTTASPDNAGINLLRTGPQRDAHRDARPFGADQTGFGVEASLGLFVLDVTAYFDSYTVAPVAPATTGQTVSVFGAAVDVDLFAGFSISVAYEALTIDGTAADSTGDAGLTRRVTGYDYIDGNYATQLGVELSHAGDAANALIRNLDLTVGYRLFNADLSGTELYVDVDYSLNVAFLTLTPYVGYSMFDNADATDDTGAYSRISAGTGLMTSALDLGFVRPSLMATVNYDGWQFTNLGGFTATELQWSVGVALDAFLFGPASSLTARYGSYTATNIDAFWPAATPAPAFGADATAGTTTTTGWEVDWNYSGLQFTYGQYSHANTVSDPTGRTAQQFRVKYTFNF
jgi:hypothetical protein